QLNQDGAPFLNEIHCAACDPEVGRRPVVGVAEMQMRDGRAGPVGVVNRLGDLVRLGRQRGIVRLGRDRTCWGDGEHHAHACRTSGAGPHGPEPAPATLTNLRLTNSPKPNPASSRPNPERLTPPNGNSGAVHAGWFTNTMPLSIWAATLLPRAVSSV